MSAEDDTTASQKAVGDAHSMPSHSGLRRFATSDLLGTDREIIIEHEGADYRLRVTSNGRLILTK